MSSKERALEEAKAKRNVGIVDTGVEIVDDERAGKKDEEYVDLKSLKVDPEAPIDLDEDGTMRRSAPDEDEEPQPKGKKKVAPKEDEDEEDELPAEYKGKSTAELIKIIKESQSHIGRQANEIGQWRKKVDDFLREELAAKASGKKKQETPVDEEPSEVDFYADPKKALESAIAKHPALQQLSEGQQRLMAAQIAQQRKEALSQFRTDFPDAGKWLNSETFKAWVDKSPYRQNLLLRAHKHFDVTAAAELFGTWSELEALRNTKSDEDEGETVSRKPTKIPSGGNAGPKSKVGKKKGEKRFRRADIVDLRVNDPERYELLADEITRAYLEDRVD